MSNKEKIRVILDDEENTQDSVATATENEENQSQIDELTKKADEYLDAAKRIQAEFDNYRKRNNDSIQKARENGANEVLFNVLKVADTIEIAAKMVVDKASLDGFMLIKKQIDSMLLKFNIVEMDAMGKDFDPNLHDAVLRVEDEENKDKVIEVLQKGYTQNGKVLRYATVKVGC